LKSVLENEPYGTEWKTDKLEMGGKLSAEVTKEDQRGKS
jgi:hypothetical protein